MDYSEVEKQIQVSSYYHDLRRDLDQILKKEKKDLGQKDIQYIKRIRARSRSYEIIGRSLIFLSFDPIFIGVGVIFL